jgi:hypothetical protein
MSQITVQIRGFISWMAIFTFWIFYREWLSFVAALSGRLCLYSKIAYCSFPAMCQSYWDYKEFTFFHWVYSIALKEVTHHCSSSRVCRSILNVSIVHFYTFLNFLTVIQFSLQYFIFFCLRLELAALRTRNLIYMPNYFNNILLIYNTYIYLFLN